MPMTKAEKIRSQLNHPVVDAATTAFWDTYLLPDPSAEPTIRGAADVAGVTKFASNAG